jgi:putative transposase
LCLYVEYWFIMNDKYKDKYRTTPARLAGWDYGSHGLYFVTICTKDKVRYFGDIINVETQNLVSLTELNHIQNLGSPSLRATEIGEVAKDCWAKIPEHFPHVELDEFVVMPDHVHGILFINQPDKTDWQINQFGAQSRNLASVIRGFKVGVKKYATLNQIDFAWQPKYHDRIIRNEKEYLNIKQYICNNPEQWLLNSGDEDDIYLSSSF